MEESNTVSVLNEASFGWQLGRLRLQAYMLSFAAIFFIYVISISSETLQDQTAIEFGPRPFGRCTAFCLSWASDSFKNYGGTSRLTIILQPHLVSLM